MFVTNFLQITLLLFFNGSYLVLKGKEKNAAEIFWPFYYIFDYPGFIHFCVFSKVHEPFIPSCPPGKTAIMPSGKVKIYVWPAECTGNVRLSCPVYPELVKRNWSTHLKVRSECFSQTAAINHAHCKGKILINSSWQWKQNTAFKAFCFIIFPLIGGNFVLLSVHMCMFHSCWNNVSQVQTYHTQWHTLTRYQSQPFILSCVFSSSVEVITVSGSSTNLLGAWCSPLHKYQTHFSGPGLVQPLGKMIERLYFNWAASPLP